MNPKNSQVQSSRVKLFQWKSPITICALTLNVTTVTYSQRGMCCWQQLFLHVLPLQSFLCTCGQSPHWRGQILMWRGQALSLSLLSLSLSLSEAHCAGRRQHGSQVVRGFLSLSSPLGWLLPTSLAYLGFSLAQGLWSLVALFLVFVCFSQLVFVSRFSGKSNGPVRAGCCSFVRFRRDRHPLLFCFFVSFSFKKREALHRSQTQE